MSARPGRFVLSIDLELGWGYRDTRLDRALQRRIQAARDSLPELLSLLVSRKVRATWATVMALELEGADELFSFDEVPSVRALERGGRSGLSEQVTRLPELYFYDEFVRELRSHPEQEVGAHTLTHLVCDRATSERCATFTAELAACQEIAARSSSKLHSLVFPGNYYSSPYLQIARRAGFTCYRGDRFVSGAEPRGALSRSLGRGGRLLGAYLGPVRSSGVEVSSGLKNIPGDRFLRLEDGGFLGRAHLARVEKELKHAAETSATYHLWFHPHNLGSRENGFERLRAVLDLFAEQASAGRLLSLTMGEVAEESEPSG